MAARVIRGEINRSKSLARVSLQANLTFRALLLAVDDFGRGEADPEILKADLFLRQQDVTPAMVYGWVQELDREGCLRLYQVGGVEYVCFPNWEKHRGKSKRAGTSRFPAPPERTENAIPQDPQGIRGCPGDPHSGSGGVGGCGGESARAAEAAEPEARLTQPTMFDAEPEPQSPQQTPEQAAEAARAAAEAALPQLEEQHRPLLNLLGKLPGSQREKELFLIDGIDQMLLEVDGDSKRLRAIVYRWYKAYLRRPLQGDVGQPRRQFEAAERRERWSVASAAHHARNAADPEVQAQMARALELRSRPLPAAFAACFASGDEIAQVARGR